MMDKYWTIWSPKFLQKFGEKILRFRLPRQIFGVKVEKFFLCVIGFNEIGDHTILHDEIGPSKKKLEHVANAISKTDFRR